MIDVAFSGPCCFCGKMIDESKVDPCSLAVQTRDAKAQVWYCHAKCFKDLIAENPYIDLSPAHF